MTRAEAIIAIEQGKKLIHYYFSPGEFIFKNSSGRYQTEDGCTLTKELFWDFHTSEIFDNDWEILQDQET